MFWIRFFVSLLFILLMDCLWFLWIIFVFLILMLNVGFFDKNLSDLMKVFDEMILWFMYDVNMCLKICIVSFIGDFWRRWSVVCMWYLKVKRGKMLGDYFESGLWLCFGKCLILIMFYLLFFLEIGLCINLILVLIVILIIWVILNLWVGL